MPNGRPATPRTVASTPPRNMLVLSTPAYDELATKLRQLDRFDVLDSTQDALQLGDVVVMRLMPRAVPPTT